MKLNWFKRRGIFFIPVTVIGWLILAASLLFAVYIFRNIDSRSHSVSDTLINFVFNLLLIGLAYTLLAFLTTRRMPLK